MPAIYLHIFPVHVSMSVGHFCIDLLLKFHNDHLLYRYYYTYGIKSKIVLTASLDLLVLEVEVLEKKIVLLCFGIDWIWKTLNERKGCLIDCLGKRKFVSFNSFPSFCLAPKRVKSFGAAVWVCACLCHWSMYSLL